MKKSIRHDSLSIEVRFVKKVIENILEEEKKARDRVEKARERAKQIRLEAETKSQQILDDARIKGMEESKALLAKAEEEAQKQKEEELQKARQQSQSIWTDKKEVIEQTVEILYRMVLGKDIDSG